MTIIVWHTKLEELKLQKKLEALLNGALCAGSLLIAKEYFIAYFTAWSDSIGSDPRTWLEGGPKNLLAGLAVSLVGVLITARNAKWSVEQLRAVLDLEIELAYDRQPQNITEPEQIEPFVKKLALQKREDTANLKKITQN